VEALAASDAGLLSFGMLFVYGVWRSSTSPWNWSSAYTESAFFIYGARSHPLLRASSIGMGGPGYNSHPLVSYSSLRMSSRCGLALPRVLHVVCLHSLVAFLQTNPDQVAIRVGPNPYQTRGTFPARYGRYGLSTTASGRARRRSQQPNVNKGHCANWKDRNVIRHNSSRALPPST
jgi:hypothetical protein